MKKYIKYIGLIVLFVGILVTIKLPATQADSGWDSSYDSGSSWSSSSDSWSSSRNSRSSSSNETSYQFTKDDVIPTTFISIILYLFITGFLIFLGRVFVKSLFSIMCIRTGILLIVLVINSKIPGFFIAGIFIDFWCSFIYMLYCAKKEFEKNSGKKYKEMVTQVNPLSQEQIIEHGLKEEELKDEFYQKFVDIQMAWMNFDYDKLQKLCSNELYNSYKSDLEVLKKKHGKNIMTDFEFLSFDIMNIEEDEKQINITVDLCVSFHDYVINEETQKVIRGNKDWLYQNHYRLQFIKNKNIEDSACPNCGGRIENQECVNCHSIVNNGYKEFVLARKLLLGSTK